MHREKGQSSGKFCQQNLTRSFVSVGFAQGPTQSVARATRVSWRNLFCQTTTGDFMRKVSPGSWLLETSMQ